jgi:hypothetical protein
MQQENIALPADNGATAQGTPAEVPQKQTAQAQAAAPVKKDRAATKAFSESLNRLSDKKAAQAAAELQKKYAGYDDVLTALHEAGYEGSAAEMASQLKGVGLSDAARARITAELIDENPAVLQARQIIEAKTFEADLARIKAAHPECDADDVLSLGDVFLKLMASGTVDAVTAYEAQVGYEARTKKTPPVSAGSLRSAEAGNQKEYYSPDEAKRIARSDLKDNPKLMERVRRSMTKWQ